MISTRKKKKGEANASNVAVVVFLIAVFLAIYILLLPAEDRQKLLEGENETIIDDAGRVVNSGEVLLLEQQPGFLKPSESEKVMHRIDPVNLFAKDEPRISDVATSINIEKSAFGENSRRLSFNSEDLNNIERATLFFNVVNGEGNLIINLNGVEIFFGKAEGLENVNLPIDLLKSSNNIEFKVSGPGWNIFGENEYRLRDLKVRQNFNVENTKEKRGFVLSAGEKGDGLLMYKLFCNSAGKNARLIINLNNKEISNEVLTCRSASREVEVDAKDMNIGNNNLEFKIDEGDYLLNEIKIEVNAEEGGGVEYRFNIKDDEFFEIEDGGREVKLEMEFSDKERHMLTINVNGDEISVDSEERLTIVDISRLIDEGNNKIKINPGNEVELLNLRIKLV